LSAHQFVCPSVCLPISFVCPSACLSICLSAHLFVCSSVCLSICLSVHLFVCPSLCLSICLSVPLFVINLSICLFAIRLSVLVSVHMSVLKILSNSLSVHLANKWQADRWKNKQMDKQTDGQTGNR